MRRRWLIGAGAAATLLAATWVLGACTLDYHEDTPRRGAALVEVARFDDQPTGVAVAPDGRTFVCFPHMFRAPANAVVEVRPDGAARPYPDERWNRWDGEDATARGAFVCVQSVHVDAGGKTLWILDPASPALQGGVVEGGAKLLEVDLATDRVLRVHAFDAAAAPEDAYLNDVRVDPAARTAYLTDSARGALVVLDLESGRARRRLEGHPSTRAEPGVTPQVGGHPWRAFFVTPKVHADGIALSHDGAWVVYHALTGRTLYRVPAAALRDPMLPDEKLAALVERLGETSCADGLEMDRAGNLYITSLEKDAIELRRPDGALEVVAQDPRLKWPDSVAVGPDGAITVAASQIHLERLFNGGCDKRERPYRVWRTAPPGAGR